jgi:hypothetical protein
MLTYETGFFLFFYKGNAPFNVGHFVQDIFI